MSTVKGRLIVISVIITLIIIGLVLYLVTTMLPIAPPIKTIINVLVVILVLLWLLDVFGILNVPTPRYRHLNRIERHLNVRTTQC